MNRTIRNLIVVLLTGIITAGSFFMIGPQIMIIVPVAILAGIVLALRRSFLSLVCLGYPFTFGLLSAYIGYSENAVPTGYGYFVSIGIGIVGVGLIAVGLWKTLPNPHDSERKN